MSSVHVELGERSYDVLVAANLIPNLGRHMAARMDARRAAIITDENVGRLYLEPVRRALSDAEIDCVEIIVAPGEASKSFATLERVVRELLAARLERSDIVVALGGGVVGDLAGFAAAITRRGMTLVQVATSLLAQVDSSVGGKTGINTPEGKNLVGAFFQPRLVLADTGVLDTLPPREFRAGYAEVAKYGLIDDADFFAWLEENQPDVFSGKDARGEAIRRSVAAKARVVAADEREAGVRALLNLGHTFGHALEAACNYDASRIIHGEGVAIGMAMAHRFSVQQGFCAPEAAERVERHLAAAGLPTHMNSIPGSGFSTSELMDHIAQDKKVKAGRLTFILSRGIGQAFIAEDIAPHSVEAFLTDELAAKPAPAPQTGE
ncbi:3-dehydroquinate synthase [Rhodopseudomonas julia]|uniref:3-dehydroquinate synthase n=1 Tax=Rhodopseudomonas julia TaxID=200617 RepID=A0ABU0C7M2_9BRAD|nr:3-dehydroquinate synthase [Rhodopseudomonas julia]MDQ0325911.1 3-dehydroquinate synthase [Rhodopseudomonas julia]